MSWTAEDVRAFRVMARAIDRSVSDLDAEVVTLMRAQASTKAAGPAHTARYLEKLAESLLGPEWRTATEESQP
ncbi:MAG TPA: hypothetical protein VKZ43_02980 [Trueperaceae bacterium]|nr:hypothetical protein [Trueperaceae bacterium]